MIPMVNCLHLPFSDRCRTTNNLLGDCYGAAVVEALSRDELTKMDEKKEILERAAAFEEQEERAKMATLSVSAQNCRGIRKKGELNGYKKVNPYKADK